MKTVLFFTALFVTVVSVPALIITLFFSNLNHMHQYEVQQLCDRSRMVTSGSLEEQCGAIQDRYHTEYLCNSLEPGAYCWTEIK